MEISQLRYFLTVAEELHFGRAASRLGITQPALSRAIQTLEKELESPLFHRSNKWRITLTAAGTALLPEAENALRQFEKAGACVRAAGRGESGRVILGAISSTLGSNALIDTLREMQYRHPQITVEVLDSNSAALEEMIRARSLDLALMRCPGSGEIADTGFFREKICDDRLFFAMRREHPLAGREKLLFPDFERERFILVPRRSSPVFRDYICRSCEEYGGFTPRIAGEIAGSYTALRLTAAGMGITVVSGSYTMLFRDRLCYRECSDFPLSLPLYAVHRAGENPPPVALFLQLFRKKVNSLLSGKENQ